MALVYLETPNLLHEILLFIPFVWVEALRWNSKPSQGPCLPQQIWNTGGHRTGCLQGGCFPLITNRGQCQHWWWWDHHWELQILTIWGLSESLTDSFSTCILFWEQTAMRWGFGFKSLGHASYLILFRQMEHIYKCIHSTNSHWFQKNCIYREPLNLTHHWETCKPLGSYCDFECQLRVNEILPTKLYPKAST